MTDQTMIERVAEALYRNSGHSAPWNAGPENEVREACLSDARAAIAAMREPTEAVLSMIAYGAIGPGMEATGASREVALSNWQAGVDGALIEGPTS